MMSAGDLTAYMRSQGYTEAAMSSVLQQAGYGSPLNIPVPGTAPSIDAWIGTVPPPTVQAGALAIPAIGAGLLAILKWAIAQFGVKQIISALLGLVGVQVFREVLNESGQGVLEGAIATIIPGQQAFLGEWPAGLGSIEGRLVQKWTAGGAKVYFASFEQPTRQGSHIQYYVYSVKRQAWLPYSYRRNIVFGARELDIAAALGGRKRIGKKKALKALAGHYGGTRGK